MEIVFSKRMQTLMVLGRKARGITINTAHVEYEQKIVIMPM
jgi:translation elongation factor EF-Tu-like GTPase